MDKQGDRFKAEELVTRRTIKPYNHVVMRLDGKAFHSYTRGMQRPFDEQLHDCMNEAMIALCKEIQGVRLAYTQSDEISLLISTRNPANPSTHRSELWMGGVEAKMLSLSAAIASVSFNAAAPPKKSPAIFDSRIAFTFPADEYGAADQLVDYFDWRRWDCNRNAVTTIAQSFYSHRELHGKSHQDRIEMIKAATGREDWESLYPPGALHGRFALKGSRETLISYSRKDTGETHSTTAMRTHWEVEAWDQPTRKVVLDALDF